MRPCRYASSCVSLDRSNGGRMKRSFIALAMFALGVANAAAQSRPVVIDGGTLIDGTGRAPLADAVVVFQDGRIRDAGRRSEVKPPEGAEVIDAKGKTILPGLIDGHCHLRDWMGEIYLHFGITTCPTISNNPTEWVIAQRDGVKNGTIRGPRVWAAGNVIDGPPPAPAHEHGRHERRGGARGGARGDRQRRRRLQALRAAPPTGCQGGGGRGAPRRQAGDRPYARHLRVGRRGLSIRRARLVGAFYHDHRPEKEKRDRLRAHYGKDQHRRVAFVHGARPVRQAHQDDGRAQRPLEPDLGHDLPADRAPRRRDAQGRSRALERSESSLPAVLYSEGRREALCAFCQSSAGAPRAARAGI